MDMWIDRLMDAWAEGGGEVYMQGGMKQVNERDKEDRQE